MITQRNIDQSYRRIISLLDGKELKNVFEFIRTLITDAGDSALEDRLNGLQETYRYLLGYRMNGVSDPMQSKIYNDLLVSTYELADALKLRLFLICETPPAFYSLRRKCKSIVDISLNEIYDNLISSINRSNWTMYDESLFLLFHKIWLSEHLSVQEKDAIASALTDKSLPSIAGCQIISALMMNLMTFFDPAKLIIIMQSVNESEDEEINARATTAMLLILYMYRNRISLYPQIENMLEALAEKEGFVQKLRTVTLRFILAKETENITRRLNDKIYPIIMKHAPDIKDLTQGELNIEMFSDKNPEWKNFQFNTSLEKTIEEYTQLQQEGADIMLSAFARSKNIEFFSNINNWFVPFSTEMCMISTEEGDEKRIKIIELTKALPFMCNSDKYSFFFNILSPRGAAVNSDFIERIRNMFMQVIEQYGKDMGNNRPGFPSTVGLYIQDLYRFFKLYQGNSGYEDIFDWELDFYNLPILKPYLADSASIAIFAEYYLKKNCFDQALSLFSRLEHTQSGDDMTMQKIGYCMQMKGNIEDALEAYLKADLIKTDSKWLTRRIAGCYRSLNQPARALEYYKRLETMNPDSLSIQLSIGHCYLEQGIYDEALKYYFKIDYLDAKSGKVWRPLAWCLFLTGKFKQAAAYYDRIMQEGTPTMHDYMNIGHTALAMNDLRKAVDFYMQAIYALNEGEGGLNIFIEHFQKDVPNLIAVGVNGDEIPLVLDLIRYEI